MSGPLLEIRALTVDFPGRHGAARVLDGVDLSLGRREVLAIVGESGSGKSMTALAVSGLLRDQPGVRVTGSIRFDGRDLPSLPARQLEALRGKRIGMIFQDPMSSLNPVLTIGRQLTEHMEYHLRLSRAESRQRAIALLGQVGISDPSARLDSYPHQFSGGMRQRVMIAMAIACEPELLIADEPTTALDVTVQSEIISLVMRLRVQSGMSVLWITHDLASIAGLSDRVAIMYSGRVVENASVDAIFEAPAHPYARALLAAAPGLDTRRGQRLPSIDGQPPDPAARPAGCAFAPRCPIAAPQCREHAPPLEPRGSSDRLVACFRVEQSLSA